MDELKQYSITVPEENIGEVMGKLNNIGGLLQGGTNNIDGMVILNADIPTKESLLFIDWLLKVTDSRGKIEIC